MGEQPGCWKSGDGVTAISQRNPSTRHLSIATRICSDRNGPDLSDVVGKAKASVHDSRKLIYEKVGQSKPSTITFARAMALGTQLHRARRRWRIQLGYHAHDATLQRVEREHIAGKEASRDMASTLDCDVVAVRRGIRRSRCVVSSQRTRSHCQGHRVGS